MHLYIWFAGILIPLIRAETDWVVHSEDGGTLETRCPCLPPSRCPRPFGNNPEDDYRAFGHLPKCIDNLEVRCCGASFRVQFDSNEMKVKENTPEVTTLETSTIKEEVTEQPDNVYVIFAKNDSQLISSNDDQSEIVIVLPETTQVDPNEIELTTETMYITTTTEMPLINTTSQSRRRESIKSILAKRRPPLFHSKSITRNLLKPQKSKNQSLSLADTQSSEVVSIRRPPRILPKVKIMDKEKLTSNLTERPFGERIKPKNQSNKEANMNFGNRFFQQMSILHNTIMNKLGMNNKKEEISVSDIISEGSSLPLTWLRSSLQDEGSISEVTFEPDHRSGEPANIIGPIPTGLIDPEITDDSSALFELPKQSMPHGPFNTTGLLPQPPPKPPMPPAAPEELDIFEDHEKNKFLDEEMRKFVTKLHKHYQMQHNYYLKQIEYYERQQKYYDDLEHHVEMIRIIGA